jgi:hypothetical protein
LNDGRIPNGRGERVALGTGYNRVEGKWRASRNGRGSSATTPKGGGWVCDGVSLSYQLRTVPPASLALHSSPLPGCPPWPPLMASLFNHLRSRCSRLDRSRTSSMAPVSTLSASAAVACANPRGWGLASGRGRTRPASPSGRGKSLDATPLPLPRRHESHSTGLCIVPPPSVPRKKANRGSFRRREPRVRAGGYLGNGWIEKPRQFRAPSPDQAEEPRSQNVKRMVS